VPKRRGCGIGIRRTAVVATTVLTGFAIVNGVVGDVVFAHAVDGVVTHVDAVVVLGGEHDGREDYGLTLANKGIASTVVLSNPYPAADSVMRRVCAGRRGAVEIICPRPEPSTTRGEAMMTRRLAVERHWTKILVLSWRYHLPRAGLVFRQCLSGLDATTTVKAVPRQYIVPIWYWEYIFLYQGAGMVKEAFADHC
jgi:uncharacterized SAM-binding protein YcdF (DUF218 family)